MRRIRPRELASLVVIADWGGISCSVLFLVICYAYFVSTLSHGLLVPNDPLGEEEGSSEKLLFFSDSAVSHDSFSASLAISARQQIDFAAVQSEPRRHTASRLEESASFEGRLPLLHSLDSHHSNTKLPEPCPSSLFPVSPCALRKSCTTALAGSVTPLRDIERDAGGWRAAGLRAIAGHEADLCTHH